MQQVGDTLTVRVRDICTSSDTNKAFCRPDFAARFLLPIEAGKLRLCENGQVLYTWARLLEPMTSAPSAETWASGHGILWLIDLVFTPNVDPITAVRAMHRDMRESEIAAAGERYLFWRSGQNRYGYARA